MMQSKFTFVDPVIGDGGLSISEFLDSPLNVIHEDELHIFGDIKKVELIEL